MVTEKVTKVEDRFLRDYELIMVISPEVLEEKLNAMIDNISQFVTGKGGNVSEVQRWGKRKLAYQIKRFTEGNYILARFKLRPTLTKELEATLRISEEVLRYLLIKANS